ncbi:glycoprotein-N-acetylgalactosamine 3-beta-galactosyltransferase 1-like [Dreissena polymorpha]|uniref:glycoprotein-N-acetylgalactosamine 3-beta-galactosyltransferase 1-like n=1 Tax=Dreissena polymorpha TaxID=45954 RepID=UPI0022642CE2|nr:glycoprotein-N-acetylgalactosamine 3-beta-galactosyltransferase 1-like [Dreissena polymorpha]
MRSWRSRIVGAVFLVVMAGVVFLYQTMPKPELNRAFRPRNTNKSLLAKVIHKDQYEITTQMLVKNKEKPGKAVTHLFRKTDLPQRPLFNIGQIPAHSESFDDATPEKTDKSESGRRDDTISKLRNLATSDSFPSGRSLSPRMRILCLILTSVSVDGITKMTAVNETWSLRCDRRLFLYSNSSEAPHSQYTLQLPVHEGRSHLTAKIRLALFIAYNTFGDAFDWILKADDDTYVIMENLRHLLAKEDPTQPVYMGFQMKPHNARGYMSGGAGYVISSRALHDLVTTGFQSDACAKDGPNEDVDIGKCLEVSGVPIRSSLDLDGKEMFHPESIYKHLKDTGSWLQEYAWNQHITGKDCCSPYSVSFHKVQPRDMYIIDYLLYNIRVFNETNPQR